MKCPICGSGELKHALSLEAVPACCHQRCYSPEEAASVKRGALKIDYCKACDFAFNSNFDPSIVAYQDYENSLAFSDVFRDFASKLIKHLTQSHQLKGKLIVELGAGDGGFLEGFLEQGAGQAVGFDLSSPSQIREINGRQLTIHQSSFRPDLLPAAPALVLFRHLLEHIAEPLEWLKEVLSLDVTRSGAIYCETPNSRTIFSELSVWDLVYEHCNYFSLRSLCLLFERAGFTVTSCRADFGNQFACLEASCVPTKCRFSSDVPAELNPVTEALSGFVNRSKVNLEDLNSKGTSVLLWGAGTKGVMFLNTVRDLYQANFVVDINPRKQGCYVAGTAKRVLGTDRLAELRPHVVLLANEIYRAEVEAKLSELSLRARVISLRELGTENFSRFSA